MTKNEFISTLNSQLSNIPENERQDMIYDYEEHFRFALEEGKTEEQVCSELGDPKELARNYKLNYKVTKAQENPSTKNVASAVFTGISLGFFNLILSLPIFLVLGVVLLAFFLSAVLIAFAGVIAIFSPALVAMFPGIFALGMSPTAAVFFGIGCVCLGALFFIGNCYLTKYFHIITLKYLRWNINILKGNKGLER